MRLWRFRQLDKLVEAGFGGVVRAIAYSKDSTLVASGSEDKSVQVWRVSDGKQQAGLSGAA